MVADRYRAGVPARVVAAYAGLVAPVVAVWTAWLCAGLAVFFDDHVRRVVSAGTVPAMALTVQGFEVSYSCLQGARYRCSTAFTSGRGIWPPAEWVGVRTIEPWWYDSAVVLGGFLLAATLFSLDVLGVLLARFPADE